MKAMNLMLSMIAVMTLIGCGTSSSTNSTPTALNDVKEENGIYTNGDDEAVNDALLVDLLGQPETTDEENTTEEVEAPTIVATVDDSFTTKNVGYTLSGANLPHCFNTEETILDYNDVKRYTCEWYCGVYEGDGPVHVKLNFVKDADIWELEEEELSTASARCSE